MGRKKKNNKSKMLKVIYAICVVIVLIAGMYYENGYTDINVFINDITENVKKITGTIGNNVKETLTENEGKEEKIVVKSKAVTGVLEMHTIDVGQR